MRLVTMGLVALLVLSTMLGARARAHPGPAAPPVFVEGDCLEVVDKETEPTWHLEYLVPVEDTDLSIGDIRLADAKTHQFFAVAGAVLADDEAHVVVPFDDRDGGRLPMPLWILAEDIERAAGAVTPADETEFVASQVAAEAVLGHDPALAALVHPLVPGTERVPITARQADKGVDWALQDVPPGVYQIVAYIFSPPFNGWAVRPGFVKVRTAEANPPAVTLNPVTGVVLRGQGRRISGCVDAPAGSVLEVAVRDPSTEPGTYEPLETQVVMGDRFEVCLGNPGLDAARSVRAELVSPDGQRASVHSPEELTLLSRQPEDCQVGKVLCCPEASLESAAADAGAGQVAEGDRMDGTSPEERVEPQAATDRGAGASGGGRPTEAGGGTRDGGCQLAPAAGNSLAPLVALLLLGYRMGRRLV